MIQAMSAPSGPVAFAKVRGSEKMPAPTLPPSVFRPDYQLGDRVRMTGTVIKRRTGRTPTHVDTTYQDAPAPVLRSTYPRGKARVDHYATEGIVVGTRTLSPGRTVYHGGYSEWRAGPEVIEV